MLTLSASAIATAPPLPSSLFPRSSPVTAEFLCLSASAREAAPFFLILLFANPRVVIAGFAKFQVSIYVIYI